uniref:NADH-ubiquinone oxidoreductase chain 1 n=1 Tax=Rhabdopleura compacta TaxID=638968 RepID=F8J482_RHACM|nr:NADH dehydrogenase subunit 1 [Rhabdopleura compacta]
MLKLVLILKFYLFIHLSVGFLTVVERYSFGGIQSRKGPSIVGWFGIFQPLMDGVKLLFKGVYFPVFSFKGVFVFSPFFGYFMSMLMWVFVPFPGVVVNFFFSVLVFLCFSSLIVYSILGGGWGSNSSYALIGSVRAVAQMVSYEVCMSIYIFLVCFWVGSYGFSSFLFYQFGGFWLFWVFFFLFLVWVIICLAESNRLPFDLVEGESELVSGYNVEYSGGFFCFYFIAEYGALIFLGVLTSLVFFGGGVGFLGVGFSSLIYSFKVMVLVLLFVWVRASLPRYRYDQLMYVAWVDLMPFGFCCLMLIIGLYYWFVMGSSFVWRY